MSTFLSVEVVVPTRNPGALWSHWCGAFGAQQTVVSGLVVDSSSDDGTDFTSPLDSLRILKIPTADFNHGDTRNLALSNLAINTEVVVFMTQDALLAEPHALSRLVSVFADHSVACAYGRQLPHVDASPVAAHARLFNYSDVSRTVSLDDKAHLGLKACFLSNSFAAYRVADLQTVGGFPSDVILGEDMYVAARLLMAGKRVAYVADACVHHSHNYSVLQEFRRYFDTGVFHARNPWLLQTFGSAGGEGIRFVRSELLYLWRYAPWWIPSAMVRTLAKLAGYRMGQFEALMPRWIKRWCSMHYRYWN